MDFEKKDHDEDLEKESYNPFDKFREWEKGYDPTQNQTWFGNAHDEGLQKYSSDYTLESSSQKFREWKISRVGEISIPKEKKSNAGRIFLALSLVILIVLTGMLIVLLQQRSYEKGSVSDGKSGDTTLDREEVPSGITLNITDTPDSSNTDDLATEQEPSSDVLSGAEINEKVSPSVVGITSITKNGFGEAGSGIIMTEDGFIITNNHVVENGEIIDVVLYDGQQYEAKIVGLDSKSDIAVIKISPDENLHVAEFGDTSKVRVGNRAFAIGSPGGVELRNNFTGGYISAIDRDIYVEDRIMTLIQTDVAINPGNSGGPLINEYGQVIGINTVKLVSDSYEGLGFAIPIDSAKIIVDELIQNGEILGRPAIGISGRNVLETHAQDEGLPKGLYVEFVDPRSDAYAQGLRQGDVVVGINNIETVDIDELNKVKSTFKAGDEITLNIYRDGDIIDVTITLMDEKELEQEEDTQAETDFGFEGQLPFFFLP